MTQFEDFLNDIPEKYQTNDVKQWLQTAENKEHESIQQGLILEFEDIVEHPFNFDIWSRFINSLTFLIRSKPYYNDVLTNINIVQQLNLEFTDYIQAPMAVSLMSMDDIQNNKSTIDFTKKPYLYINLKGIWLMMIDIYDAKFDTKTKDKMFDTLIGLLVHETYHHLRGDLLTESKHHYTSPNKNQSYQKALEKEPFEFDIDGHTQEIKDIHTLRNILMDASINADIIKNVSTDFFPEKLQRQYITPLSTNDSFKKVVDFSKDPNNQNKTFKPTSDFGIYSESEFFNDDINIKQKQYAILEMLDADDDDNDEDNDDSNSENSNSSNSDNSNDGSGEGNENGLSDGQLQGKHSDALGQTSEQEKDNIASNMNNIINVANQAAQAESNGKAKQLEAEGDLKERIVQIQKAKALPKLDRKVESLINDFNREKRLNWNRRHIAYSNRLDMAHHEKLLKEKGFYAYLDVSGSVTDELLSNLFNILYETSKQEPCYLYVFATEFATEPFEIKRKSTVDDILNYISEQDVGFTTNFENVFKHIVETQKYKHAIFSDYMFAINDYIPYRQETMKSPIIHVAENINQLEVFVPNLYKDILKNRQYQKLIQQSDYIEQERTVK